MPYPILQIGVIQGDVKEFGGKIIHYCSGDIPGLSIGARLDIVIIALAKLGNDRCIDHTAGLGHQVFGGIKAVHMGQKRCIEGKHPGIVICVFGIIAVIAAGCANLRSGTAGVLRDGGIQNVPMSGIEKLSLQTAAAGATPRAGFRTSGGGVFVILIDVGVVGFVALDVAGDPVLAIRNSDLQPVVIQSLTVGIRCIIGVAVQDLQVDVILGVVGKCCQGEGGEGIRHLINDNALAFCIIASAAQPGLDGILGRDIQGETQELFCKGAQRLQRYGQGVFGAFEADTVEICRFQNTCIGDFFRLGIVKAGKAGGNTSIPLQDGYRGRCGHFSSIRCCGSPNGNAQHQAEG